MMVDPIYPAFVFTHFLDFPFIETLDLPRKAWLPFDILNTDHCCYAGHLILNRCIIFRLFSRLILRFLFVAAFELRGRILLAFFRRLRLRSFHKRALTWTGSLVMLPLNCDDVIVIQHCCSCRPLKHFTCCKILLILHIVLHDLWMM